MWTEWKFHGNEPSDIRGKCDCMIRRWIEKVVSVSGDKANDTENRFLYLFPALSRRVCRTSNYNSHVNRKSYFIIWGQNETQIEAFQSSILSFIWSAFDEFHRFHHMKKNHNSSQKLINLFVVFEFNVCKHIHNSVQTETQTPFATPSHNAWYVLGWRKSWLAFYCSGLNSIQAHRGNCVLLPIFKRIPMVLVCFYSLFVCSAIKQTYTTDNTLTHSRTHTHRLTAKL